VGVTQTNPKSVLAYSSISQMGLMTVGIGASSAVGVRVYQTLAAYARIIETSVCLTLYRM
jgi:NADH:ubiquinone oxidoreductase subunit 5 (subunit L)/multisubunit Na+/H+ antiporter MnhA subunit